MKAKILAVLTVGLLSAPLTSLGASVIIGGIEWRQLTDTEGFTWDQVAAACPTNGTACSGLITRTNSTTVDVTGWTWASNEDIRVLFDDIIEPGTVNIPIATNYSEPASWSYIDNIIGTGTNQFAETYRDGSSSFVTGWTSTGTTSGYGYSPFLRDFWDGAATDYANTQSQTIKGLASAGTGDLGVWLRRPAPSAVPIPAAAWLLLSGLGGLGLLVRRRH